MLRIGLLLDHTSIQAWQAEAIRQIVSTGLAEISVLILNKSPKSPGNLTPFLYRFYRALDRLLFKSNWDAFRSVSIFDSLPRETDTISIKPIQKKYRDIFSEVDLDKMEEFDLDVIVRFGFRILSGKVLTLPKLGVWSFHHGDPEVYTGGPPAFWEVMNQIPSTGCVLMRINEKLDQGDILCQSWTQTDPLSVQRNANRIFWLSASFPARVIREIEHLGIDRWILKIDYLPSRSSGPLWTPPRSKHLLSLFSKLLFRNIHRKWNEFLYKPHWEIGYIEEVTFKNQLIEPKNIQYVKNPTTEDFYLADPFPIQHQGSTWVFAERYSRSKKKGEIVTLDEKGRVQSIIQENWHLSYPFVWKENDQFLMIPESAQSGNIWKYVSLEFPTSWKKKEVFLPVEGFDPTLWKDKNGFWLFINQRAHPACSPFDELHLYFSKSLDQPNWQPHGLNPIVSDVRRSRPAGKLFLEKGKLYRPAQDSEKRYGHRIRLMEVKKLSLAEYEEQEVCKIEPNEWSGILGIHTLNKIGNRWILDFYFKR